MRLTAETTDIIEPLTWDKKSGQDIWTKEYPPGNRQESHINPVDDEFDPNVIQQIAPGSYILPITGTAFTSLDADVNYIDVQAGRAAAAAAPRTGTTGATGGGLRRSKKRTTKARS